MNSINTNVGAMVALQNLNSVNSDLSKVQNRVSTGMKVSSAADDGGAFAVAQGLRGDIKGFEAVNQQLSVAKGSVGVASSAATSVRDTLNDVKATLTKLADDGLSAEQRAQYSADFTAQMGEVANFIANSNYNGASLLQAASTDQDVISNVDGSTYTIAAQDLETSTAALTAAAPANAAAAQALLDGTNAALNTAVTATDNALNSLGADTKRLDNQIKFNTAVSDATEAGLGAIVDADLARESAKMQALQTKQQLSVQALGMANQGPSALLGLFR